VAGRELVSEIKHYNLPYQTIGFLDDDRRMQNKMVAGLRILGRISNLRNILDHKKIEEIFIAIPSGSGQLTRKIVRLTKGKRVKIKIIPRILEIISGKVNWPQIRDLRPEDLIGRPIYKKELRPIKKILRNKKLLITGAAGSIGSEIARQVALFQPKLVLCLDFWENGFYQLEVELKRKFPKINFKFIIANIQDSPHIDYIFGKYKPEIVFHAAAYKHVSVAEENPAEAVKNNIFATFNLAQISIKNRVKKFVFLSTDKAVNPTGVMGASKLFSEEILQLLNHKNKTKFIVVRFGNVIASYGSVIPIFKKQILEGGPVTITDRRVFRYFMTISEAVQLILRALILGNGGEIFALEMGEPIKIIDLAHDLIRFYGFSGREIKIKIVGLRPGEKLEEENLVLQPGISSTKFKKIFLFKKEKIDSSRLLRGLNKLEIAVKKDDNKKVISILKVILPSFKNNKL